METNTQPLIPCVALSKSLHLPKPQLPHLCNGMNYLPPGGVGKIKLDFKKYESARPSDKHLVSLAGNKHSFPFPFWLEQSGRLPEGGRP